MRRFDEVAPLALAILFFSAGCGGTETRIPASLSTSPTPAAPVSVSVPQSSVTVNLGAGQSQQFNANVTGTSNAGVTWSLSGCTGSACGTITSTGLYTAPSAIAANATITLTATSQADPTKYANVTIHLMAVAVQITPTGAVALFPGSTLNFTATVQYDVTQAGVTWALQQACSGGDCGTLSNAGRNSVAYTAPTNVPDPGMVRLMATSIADPGRTAEVIITVSRAGLQEGDYAFLFSGWEGNLAGGTAVIAGRFHADAQGDITDGVQDLNLASGVSLAVPFTGTYGVGADGRGTLAIFSSQGHAAYHFTVDTSNQKGRITQYDSPALVAPVAGTGLFEPQDRAAFSLSALAGSYAVRVYGRVETNDMAAVGRFTANADGGFTGGRMDVSVLSGTLESSTNLVLTGGLDPPSMSTGRGTVTLGPRPAPRGVYPTWDFAYYVVSSTEILLVEAEVRVGATPVLGGQMRRQVGTFTAASFRSPVIFSLAGSTWFGPVATVGRIVPDGAGSLTGTLDQNCGACINETITLNQAFLGSYAVEGDGRSTISLDLGPRSRADEVAYFFGPNEAFLMEISAPSFAKSQAAVGSLRPQSGGPFAAVSLSGCYVTSTALGTFSWGDNYYSGVTTFSGESAVTLSRDVSAGYASPAALTGNYAVAADGRGTLTLPSASPEPALVVWVISPSELVGMTSNRGDMNPVLLDFKK